MEDSIFFFAGLSLILVHEMDAMRCQEWTIIPLLSRLNENMGYLVFTVIHIPLYLILLTALFGEHGLNPVLIMGLDIFFIIHVFLHGLFLRHPKNQFASAFSWVIIFGAGIAGLMDMIV